MMCSSIYLKRFRIIVSTYCSDYSFTTHYYIDSKLRPAQYKILYSFLDFWWSNIFHGVRRGAVWTHNIRIRNSCRFKSENTYSHRCEQIHARSLLSGLGLRMHKTTKWSILLTTKISQRFDSLSDLWKYHAIIVF